jgi:hypothetical protein
MKQYRHTIIHDNGCRCTFKSTRTCPTICEDKVATIKDICFDKERSEQYNYDIYIYIYIYIYIDLKWRRVSSTRSCIHAIYSARPFARATYDCALPRHGRT